MDFFLNRNIEYVAVSRAQEKLIIIGWWSWQYNFGIWKFNEEKKSWNEFEDDVIKLKFVYNILWFLNINIKEVINIGDKWIYFPSE